MTIQDFQARLVGFINRDAQIFTQSQGGNLNQVTFAMHDAVRAAQREHTFALNRTDAFLTTSEVGANWMTACKSVPSGTTSVLMKRVDSVWNYSTTSVTAGTVYARTSRIDLDSSGAFKRELPVDSGSSVLDGTSLVTTRRKFAYLNGQNLHITTVGTATPVLVNGIKFIDAVTDNDIFLTYFQDWLHWATLIQLNQYLKQDQRINIDLTFVSKLWQSVKEMDGQTANSGDYTSLD